MTQLMKTTSQLAIAVMASVLATSAFAADLGGNCCTDLEERVAELEATTARKGNRKVSLQIYGQVSEAVIWWNDGSEKNIYVQENNAVKNLLGFTGSAKIASDWSAGYTLEVQMRAYRSSVSNQFALGNQNGYTDAAYGTVSVTMRKANWYLNSETYGRIIVGRDNDAAVGTGSVNLANPDGFQASGVFMGFANGGYNMRRSGTTGNIGLSAANWSNWAYIPNGDGPVPLDTAHTSGLVKYVSPFFLGHTKSSGFQTSFSWGKDDIWASALRYAEEFGGFRFAAAASYSESRDLYYASCANPSTTGGFNGGVVALNPGGAATAPAAGVVTTALAGAVSNTSCNTFQASASLMHTPTGLYMSGGGGQVSDDQRQKALNLAMNGNAAVRNANADKNDSFWWLQAGWEAKLNPIGKTTFYGTYGQYDRGTGVAANGIQTLTGADVLNPTNGGGTVYMTGSQTTQWGLGVTQAIDAAAMNLYLGYINTSVDMNVARTGGPSAGVVRKANPIDDNSVLYTGATIKF